MVVIVADAHRTVICWSNGARALLEFTADDVIGRPLDALLSADGPAFRHRRGVRVDGSPLVFPLILEGWRAGYLLTVAHEADSHPPDDDQLLTWAFYGNPIAIGVTDLDGRLLCANQAMARAAGSSEAELRGHNVTEFLTGPGFSEITRQLLRVAEPGVPKSMEAYVRSPGEPQAPAWAIDTFPLTDENDQTHAVATCIYDYSEQYGLRKRIALINEARTRLGMSLDVWGTGRELAEVVVPRFADAVAVDLLGKVLGGKLPTSVPVGRLTLRRTAFLPHSGTPFGHLAPGELVVHPVSSPWPHVCEAGDRSCTPSQTGRSPTGPEESGRGGTSPTRRRPFAHRGPHPGSRHASGCDAAPAKRAHSGGLHIR
ncbi:PAS domain-containing protein [Streptomyces sp. NBC_00988]|uniref:PAS domain-containing protein n=1 Tax=Streptomyces sp. NBC_00988 TaxID=2903704 RepID=UPI00386ADC6D|nr:PAS domain-containing protein [Streptomyces sp. NBC_00988]